MDHITPEFSGSVLQITQDDEENEQENKSASCKDTCNDKIPSLLSNPPAILSLSLSLSISLSCLNQYKII